MPAPTMGGAPEVTQKIVRERLSARQPLPKNDLLAASEYRTCRYKHPENPEWNYPLGPSYVLGNSWQLKYLTLAERKHLDRAPWVFCVNHFPEHWRLLGFRPTCWMLLDTHTPQMCALLRRQLDVIRSDTLLRSRLLRLFVSETAALPEIRRIVEQSGLPVSWFTTHCSLPVVLRGMSWRQPPYSLYHHASVLTAAAHLACILNPGAEVRLAGCQYLTRPGYFYDIDHGRIAWPGYLDVTCGQWAGFSNLRNCGADLIDCNLEHGDVVPAHLVLPRKDFCA